MLDPSTTTRKPLEAILEALEKNTRAAGDRAGAGTSTRGVLICYATPADKLPILGIDELVFGSSASANFGET
jgi:hypothetical protein